MNYYKIILEFYLYIKKVYNSVKRENILIIIIINFKSIFLAFLLILVIKLYLILLLI